MALVGGLEAPPGRIMGHAGAWAAPGEPDAQTKYQALERAGAVMVNHPEKFGEGMKALLGGAASRPSTTVSLAKGVGIARVTLTVHTVLLGSSFPKAMLSHHEAGDSTLENHC